MKVIIIGSGIGGMSAAITLAKRGHSVTVVEKHTEVGGRAGYFSEHGYEFNRGPSWYLMPELFEQFYISIGEDINNHLKLIELPNRFQVTFQDSLLGTITVPNDKTGMKKLFESVESGAGEKLEDYLDYAAKQYQLVSGNFIKKNFASPVELLKFQNVAKTIKLSPFKKYHEVTKKYFKSPLLQKIIDFPSMFVGTSPFDLPAAYHMLNHAVLSQPMLIPSGGMSAVTKSLETLTHKYKINILKNTQVVRINTQSEVAMGVTCNSGETISADIVISNAGTTYTKKHLLGLSGSPQYSRDYSPSALLMYLGIDKPVPQLEYHNIFLGKEWKKQFDDLRKTDSVPDNPSFYVNSPSSDLSSQGAKSNFSIFVLVPISNKVHCTNQELGTLRENTLSRLEQNFLMPSLRKKIVYEKIFSPHDFAERYHSPFNSMLGPNHRFGQTGPFRNKIKSADVENLYYVGADTLPGIGVPMCLVSGQLVAAQILKS